MTQGLSLWHRFTLLHSSVLVAGLAVGMAMAPSFHSQGPPPVIRQSIAEWTVLTLIIGLAVAGPLTIGVQVVLQGRRTQLSLGEWTWLSPGISYLIVIPLSQMYPSPIWLFTILPVHAVNLACSARILLGWLYIRRPSAPCAWTNVLGALSSGSAALYFFSDLFFE